MAERYFIDDDKLNRKRYADFLRTIIDNSDKYKRNSEEKSYVIAVDSSWGTGKTYFTDMFENYLLGFDGKDLKNNNGGYTVIRFDAWKNDFWDNAFEPFVVSIMEKDIFGLDRDSKNAESLLNNFWTSAGIIAKGIIKKKAADYIDSGSLEEAINISLGSAKDFLLRDLKIFSDYQKFKKGIEDFKEILLGLVDDKRKIVIIIDELDRCKPTFSIQLLEIVKHLFDMSGITFLFMIDIEQLSHSVKTIYGQDMDAAGYLCRFFDYIARMPKPDLKTYIEVNLKGISVLNRYHNYLKQRLLDCFCYLSEHYVLSLRDIDTILCSYKLMLDSFLQEYEEPNAHCLYLFYLILKYKNMFEFNNIFLKTKLSDNLKTADFRKFPFIRESLKNINSTMGSLAHASYSNDSTGIIFGPDRKKWEEIKNMQYGQYIHQQLEMFNFVNPDIK